MHRVKNCRSRNVSLGCTSGFEIAKTDLVSVTDELLGNLEKFLESVGHVCWAEVEEIVGWGERYWLRSELRWQEIVDVLSKPT